ncbi:MAG: DegT/DnrJ/EryC1/StrS family aminotransferase [Fuerstiella sp.]|nr:DegT/DnrJ/EryC1/StrS family aminotransferase [Fuerstiella sp.]MCP4856429.1 DegT/DnrJ/EryC1/StrS family aminotransferase [Fuerstiella sp.]
MDDTPPISRREFVATSTVAAATIGVSATAEATPAESLAIQGGKKAVTEVVPAWERWGEPEAERLDDLLKQSSLFYWNGPQTKAFIERFQQHCPSTHVQTCSSGTAALHIAVAAANIAPGDEVITSPITDIGTVIGVLFQQAVPVFADVEPDTYNLDPDDVARKITPRTKAIIPVHLAGNPCDMKRLMALAEEHNLVVIEDCAQAWGARYRGKPVGTMGHACCFSMMNSKHVTTGDGGVVASSDGELGRLLQRFGDKGTDRVDRTPVQWLASNYRMSEAQAAIGAAQLERLEAIAARRNQLGRLLTQGIRGLPGITPHREDETDRSTYWFYMFRIQPDKFRVDRAQLVKAMRAEGTGASEGYIRRPLYGEQMFQDHSFFAGEWPIHEAGLTKMNYRDVHCSEAEAALQTGIRLRLTENMTDKYVEQLAAGIRKVVDHYAA